MFSIFYTKCKCVKSYAVLQGCMLFRDTQKVKFGICFFILLKQFTGRI